MTKKKHVELNVENSNVLLPGRHPCECQALKHKLVNNCLKCGRIVCQQEGSGPCFFCKNIVCTNEEQEILNRGSKTSDKLFNKLLHQDSTLIPPAMQKAMDNKNRLLNYDRLSAARTQVIDDQSDYFLSNASSWLSPGQSKLLIHKEMEQHEAKHGSRFLKPTSININFDAEEDQYLTVEKDDQLKMPDIPLNTPGYVKGDIDTRSNIKDVCLKFKTQLKLDSPQDKEPPLKTLSIPKTFQKVQDADLQASFDQKKCLSMHQPYASLLVFGVKKEEGRTWYTNHRGRLWIASTGKPAPPADIQEVETFYKLYYENLLGKEEALRIKYPHNYPTGVLLGCVNVDDCLTQEDYRKIDPNGVSESPFVWLCSEPKKLKFNIPMMGKPKIFDLDSQLWRAATKNLIYEA